MWNSLSIRKMGSLWLAKSSIKKFCIYLWNVIWIKYLMKLLWQRVRKSKKCFIKIPNKVVILSYKIIKRLRHFIKFFQKDYFMLFPRKIYNFIFSQASNRKFTNQFLLMHILWILMNLLWNFDAEKS